MKTPGLKYYKISPSVTAFTTTRHGGVGQNKYSELNINPYCGDDPAAVAENKSLLCKKLGIEETHLILPKQVHGSEILMVGEELLTVRAETRKMLLDGIDGLMTDVKGVCIGISTADCMPILLYDVAHEACCAVHAGWRGTLSRIVVRAIRSMEINYGTNPLSLKAVIGPGISLKNFEVGDEVYSAFGAAGFDMQAIASRYDKWHINLPKCNKLLIKSLGVPEKNIFTSKTCTFDKADDFFSARRMGVESGRMFTGIMMK